MEKQTLTEEERQAFLTRQGAFDQNLREDQRQAILAEWSDDSEILHALEMGF